VFKGEAMSGLEINKIIGAVLAAGVIAMFAGFVSHLAVQPEQLAENAYPVEGVVPAEAETAEAPAATVDEPESVLPLLASADAAAGEKAVRKCTACHTLDEGGVNKIGPNLWNIVGRGIASTGGYSYSGDLQGKSGESWTYENLDGFLSKPKAWAPGTKMSFAGLKKAKERADLIVYLRSLSASPPPLPE
jgi:cytochrome c